MKRPEPTVSSRGAPDLRLEAVGLSVHGHRPFWGLDLRLQAGVPALLTGPSGSGKSLLCMVLAGRLPPTTGTVMWGDRPATEGLAGQAGVVLQDHGLVGGLTAFENVALPLQERRFEPLEITERSRTALDRVGLLGQADRLVDELSGGEQQRVGIARAVAGQPAVLIADEPTSELDPENRERVLGLLLDEERRGWTIVVVASDDPEVAAHFDHVLVLGDGTVTEVSRERSQKEVPD